MALDTWELCQVRPWYYCFSEMSLNGDQDVWESARKNPDSESLRSNHAHAALEIIYRHYKIRVELPGINTEEGSLGYHHPAPPKKIAKTI